MTKKKICYSRLGLVLVLDSLHSSCMRGSKDYNRLVLIILPYFFQLPSKNTAVKASMENRSNMFLLQSKIFPFPELNIPIWKCNRKKTIHCFYECNTSPKPWMQYVPLHFTAYRNHTTFILIQPNNIF